MENQKTKGQVKSNFSSEQLSDEEKLPFVDLPKPVQKAIAPYYVLATTLSEAAYVNEDPNKKGLIQKIRGFSGGEKTLFTERLKPLPPGTRNVPDMFEGTLGYWENKNSRLRIMESEDGKTLVVSFSGSDDLKDFLQDGNGLKGMEKYGKVGTSLISGGLAGVVAYQSVKGSNICRKADSFLEKAECQIVASSAGIIAIPIGAAAARAVQKTGAGKGGPEEAYKELGDGNAYVLNLIKNKGNKYERIIVAGHSLGGNLATQFVGEMAEKLPNALAKTDLLTLNSLGLSNDIPPGLHRQLFFRQKNDITDIVQPFNGLKKIPETSVIHVDGKIDRDPSTIFNAGDVARRHSAVEEKKKSTAVMAQCRSDDQNYPGKEVEVQQGHTQRLPPAYKIVDRNKVPFPKPLTDAMRAQSEAHVGKVGLPGAKSATLDAAMRTPDGNNILISSIIKKTTNADGTRDQFAQQMAEAIVDAETKPLSRGQQLASLKK